MSDRLTTYQRRALDLMLEAHRRYPNERYEAATCSGPTFLDDTWPVFLNFHTARALMTKGLVTAIEKDPEEGWSIALTDEVLISRGMSRAPIDADHDANVKWLRR